MNKIEALLNELETTEILLAEVRKEKTILQANERGFEGARQECLRKLEMTPLLEALAHMPEEDRPEVIRIVEVPTIFIIRSKKFPEFGIFVREGQNPNCPSEVRIAAGQHIMCFPTVSIRDTSHHKVLGEDSLEKVDMLCEDHGIKTLFVGDHTTDTPELYKDDWGYESKTRFCSFKLDAVSRAMAEDNTRKSVRAGMRFLANHQYL